MLGHLSRTGQSHARCSVVSRGGGDVRTFRPCLLVLRRMMCRARVGRPFAHKRSGHIHSRASLSTARPLVQFPTTHMMRDAAPFTCNCQQPGVGTLTMEGTPDPGPGPCPTAKVCSKVW